MRRLPYLHQITFVFLVSCLWSCRKDDIKTLPIPQTEPLDIGLSEDYLGDWYIYSELFYKNSGAPQTYDSIEIYNTQNLGLTFTDSLLYKEKPFSYYRCIENLHGSTDLTVWNGLANNATISHANETTNIHFASIVNYLSTKENKDLRFIELSSNIEDKHYLLGRIPREVESDSVTYILQFHNYIGTLEGLIIRYISNDGTYDTDTLESGQWHWEKTVKQISLNKTYAVEMIGGTEDYHDELSENFYGKFDLLMRYRPFKNSPKLYELKDVVECTITTSGEFSSESYHHLAGHLRYVERYIE
ncbi:MAG: hypothetical protein ACI8ZM_003844 [Crocinitomix sp.]|jgi:hypothetical protein